MDTYNILYRCSVTRRDVTALPSTQVATRVFLKKYCHWESALLKGEKCGGKNALTYFF